VRWLVDPVDGTTNYLYGHAGFAVSIAAEVDGSRAVGVVHDPLHGEVFAARAGGGATRNGQPISCSDKADLQTALVATGFAYDPARRGAQAAVLERVIPHVRDIRRMGAASVDLCSVACGRVDAYYERGLGPWDLAAGAVIATEAGARVGNLDGVDDIGDLILAAAPGVFDPLAELLAAAGAREA
jgi:myo-inositol-1(or 4)-monophosphatase